MTVYRIARRAFADLSGNGGTVYSGRWHFKGHRIIYAAGSVALAALEYAVHTSVRPVDTVLMEIVMPKDDLITIENRLGGELPGNWAFVADQSRQLGTDWLIERKTLILSVPSVVVPFERNLLINPNHPLFAKVVLKQTVPFFFDPRIFN